MDQLMNCGIGHIVLLTTVQVDSVKEKQRQFTNDLNL